MDAGGAAYEVLLATKRVLRGARSTLRPLTHRCGGESMGWLKKLWKKLTKPMAMRDDTRHGPQGGPYGGPLK
jgi:hypothetical protein